ncbi:M20/M25/M40 family metallo-hydrolase, partial [uncultured Muribaculum sp.]
MDELFYQAVDLLKQLISTPSISRDEAAAADIVEQFINNAGHQTRRHNNNVWTIADDYDPSRPTLLLNSHIDTVKPAPGWQHDPFTPQVDDENRLFGLGSNDAGASLVSLLAAYLFMSGKERSYNLVFLASCEEEVSGRDGIEAAIPLLPHIDVAIVGEPTGMNPAIAEKGLMVLDAEIDGVAGHAARNEGVNAIYQAMPVIETLRHLRLPKESATLGPVKISVTQINAGTQHNVVPSLCKMVVDIRTTDA